MQWIKFVHEDAGIQNLKADNRRPVITRNVDAVSPYPSTHAPRIGEGTQRDTRQHSERRANDRRTGNDRREKQDPVLLDTRSKHDRRAIGNRRTNSSADADTDADTDDDKTTGKKHLNLYV